MEVDRKHTRITDFLPRSNLLSVPLLQKCIGQQNNHYLTCINTDISCFLLQGRQQGGICNSRSHAGLFWRSGESGRGVGPHSGPYRGGYPAVGPGDYGLYWYCG